MKEHNLHVILSELITDKISVTEKQSFMYFLKGCGAYHEFIKEIDIEQVNLLFNTTYCRNQYLLYSNIITASLLWRTTASGLHYWQIIHYLHKIILNIKFRYGVLGDFDKSLIFLSKNYVSRYKFQFLMDEYSKLGKEDKKLKSFIDELYSYLQDNNILK